MVSLDSESLASGRWCRNLCWTPEEERRKRFQEGRGGGREEEALADAEKKKRSASLRRDARTCVQRGTCGREAKVITRDDDHHDDDDDVKVVVENSPRARTAKTSSSRVMLLG